MSEAEFETGHEVDSRTGRPTEPVRTGVTAVDEVLASVDALAQAPLEQHAAAFGAAHDALRRALDAEPEA